MNIQQKRFASIFIAIIMVFTAAYITSDTVSAASAKPYMTSQADYTGTIKEKLGKYYIWVETVENEEGDITATRLQCATSLKGDVKILKTVNGKNGKHINETVVTNGSTIFYIVRNEKTDKGTIYKTTVKGAKSKKIKSAKRMYGLATYYGGKIYYNMAPGKANTPVDKEHLYSYQIKKKKTRLEKKNFVANSGYGKYIPGKNVIGFDMGNEQQYLYNAKSKKSKKTLKAYDSLVYGKTVYYIVTTSKWQDQFSVKKSNLSGKKVKKIKTLKKGLGPIFFGKRASYFQEFDSEVITKLVYKTKKLTTIEK